MYRHVRTESSQLAFSMAKIWWLKYCCSCSLARLIQNCSKLLWSKFSKPKMSRIPVAVRENHYNAQHVVKLSSLTLNPSNTV